MADEKGRPSGFVVGAVSLIVAATAWYSDFGGMRSSGTYLAYPAMALMVASAGVAYFILVSAERFGIGAKDAPFIAFGLAASALALSALAFGNPRVATGSIATVLAVAALAPAAALYIRQRSGK